jgi:hypothetical protein
MSKTITRDQAPTRPKPAPVTIELPAERTTPDLRAETSTILLYGPAKIGKTTLAAGLDPERTLFLATEPGLKALSVFAVPISSWEQFVSAVDQLRDDERFDTIVIDTIDELVKFCSEKVTRDLGIAHPSDLEYGKGWGAVTDELRLRVAALCSLGKGVWFISHATDQEVKKRVGSTTVTVPSLSSGPRKFLSGFCDFILLARSELGEEGETRVLRTRATENYEAGGRVPLTDPLPLDAAALRTDIERACGAKEE